MGILKLLFQYTEQYNTKTLQKEVTTEGCLFPSLDSIDCTSINQPWENTNREGGNRHREETVERAGRQERKKN